MYMCLHIHILELKYSPNHSSFGLDVTDLYEDPPDREDDSPVSFSSCFRPVMSPYSGRGDGYIRAGGGHGIMPQSPYNAPQMSPYGGAQVPQVALMGGVPPLTPEMHPSSMMGYQLVRQRLWTMFALD